MPLSDEDKKRLEQSLASLWPPTKDTVNNNWYISKKSAIHFAAELGDYEKVDTTIKLGADVNKLTDEHQTPLLLALVNQHLAIAQLLIERGADANVRVTKEGFTAVHYATAAGNVGLLKSMIANKGDLHLRDFVRNMTPLGIAIVEGRSSCVTVILDALDKMPQEGFYESSPLHLAIRSNHPDIAVLILAGWD